MSTTMPIIIYYVLITKSHVIRVIPNGSRNVEGHYATHIMLQVQFQYPIDFQREKWPPITG